MKLEDIHKEWEIDAIINPTQILEANIQTAKLLQKYLRYLSYERLQQKKLNQEYKELKFEKRTFLSEGPSEEFKEKGWKLPPKGRILKSEVDLYLEVDKDVSDLYLKIEFSKEKILVLEEIIKELHARQWIIKNHISWVQWTGGV